MARGRATKTAPVSVNFSAAEKSMLSHRARDAGQTPGEYIRERVLAEADCEEQILRFMADELTRTAEDAKRVVAEGRARDESDVEEPWESPEAQRGRIAKAVRESFTQRELDALARLFKPAFDAGLWPESPGTNQSASGNTAET